MRNLRKYPQRWRLEELRDVAEIVMGQSPPGINVFDWSGDIYPEYGLPFIQGNAEFGSIHPEPDKWCIKPLKVAESGDMLISVRAPVGETNHANKRMAIGRGLAAIRFISANTRFGWHLVNHAKDELRRVAQGSTFHAVGRTELFGLPVALPPFGEQRAIADVLDSIDEAIERTEAVVDSTEQLRSTLQHHLLTQGITGLHTSWKHVPRLGTIPKHWRVARVIDVFDILDSRRVPLNADERAKMPGSFPYYGANGVVDYIGDWIFDERDNLILLAEDGGHFGEFMTRRIAYRVCGKCWVNNHAHILKPKEPTASSFLFHSLVNKDVRPFINGTTRSKLTQRDLGEMLIGLPQTNVEIEAIGRVLDAADASLVKLASEESYLRQTKLSLSNELLSGSLRIPMGGVMAHADA